MPLIPDHRRELKKLKRKDWKEWSKLVNWYILEYYQEFSNKEISEALDIPEANVSNRAHLMGIKKNDGWHDRSEKTKALRLYCNWIDNHFECKLKGGE
jgi:hypothetical protein